MMGQVMWINSNNNNINNSNNNSNNNTIFFSVLNVTGWDFVVDRLRGLYSGGYLNRIVSKTFSSQQNLTLHRHQTSMHHQLQITQYYIFIRKHSNIPITMFKRVFVAHRGWIPEPEIYPSLRGTTRCRLRLPIMKFRLWVKKM